MKRAAVFPVDARPISEAQRVRLYAIARLANFDSDELHEWLLETYGREHLGDIQRNEYDHICAALGAGTEDETQTL
jgi:hypothetical protein